MADFNAKDPNAWQDRRAQGDAAVQSINNMPFVFNKYTNGGGGGSSGAQGDAAVQSINNMPFVFSQYTNGAGVQTPEALMSILFPGNRQAATSGSAPSITQALLGLLGASGFFTGG